MNIVMLCRLYTPHIGGVEKHVEGISKEAVLEGNTADIFTLKHVDGLQSFEIKDGIRIHRTQDPLKTHWIPTSTGMTVQKIAERLFIWSWLLRHILTFIQADRIHIHDVFFWYWPLRLLLPWKKVYITFHGFEAGTLPTTKAKKARLLATQWTRGNIAVGGWIEKWYGTKADFVTYGAGICTYPPKYLDKSSKQEHLVDAVFLGRLSEDTGVCIYADVISTLRNYQLDIFGQGELKSEMRSIQKRTKNIRICGSIEDSCTVFPNYDIACVSSYLSIIEAMQSRTLVLAYASDELKLDYLHSHPMAENMIIVKSPEELKKFLTDYKKHDYSSKVATAYTWAREQTWKKVYLDYNNLWQT